MGGAPCLDKPAVCAGCRQQRRVVSRDRHGRPRCAKCPDIGDNPLEELTQLVTGMDPVLDADTIRAALERATKRPAGQRRLAWAVIARPELLTNAGHEAPTPAMLRFISSLVTSDATTIVRPACPRCHIVKTLSKLLNGQQICRACFATYTAVPCVCCGAVREPAARDADSQPVSLNRSMRTPVDRTGRVGCGRPGPGRAS